MGAIAAPLAIAQGGLSLVSGFSQSRAAAANASAQYRANFEQLQHIVNDAARREAETEFQADQAVSDRVRVANQDTARTVLMAGDAGVSGATRAQMINALAFAEGTDISRIRTSSQSQIEAIRSEVEAARVSLNSSNRTTYNQARVQSQGAMLGALGSGLQIASGYYSQQRQLDAGRNTF